MTKLTPAQQKVMNHIAEGFVLKIPEWSSTRYGLVRRPYLTRKRDNGSHETIDVHATTAKNVRYRLQLLDADHDYRTYGQKNETK